MADDVKRFLDSIAYKENREDVKNVQISKVLLHKNVHLFEVVMHNNEVLPYETVRNLYKACENKINQKEECTITLEYQSVTKEDVVNYVSAMMKEYVEEKPSLISVLSEKPSIENNQISLQVSNKTEAQEMQKEVANFAQKLRQYGLGDYHFIVHLNEEMQKSIQEEIQKSKTETERIETKPKIEGNILLGKEITGEVTAINNIMGDVKNVVFEAYIFGIETLEREKRNRISYCARSLSRSNASIWYYYIQIW